MAQSTTEVIGPISGREAIGEFEINHDSYIFFRFQCESTGRLLFLFPICECLRCKTNLWRMRDGGSTPILQSPKPCLHLSQMQAALGH